MGTESGAPQREFDPFYAAEYPRVFRAALLFCGDHEIAEDATQEAFVRAYARWARLRKETWAGGWAMTTALNYARRRLRHGRRTVRLGPSDADRPDGRAWQTSEEVLDALDALQRLAPRQRTAVLLHYLADLPVAAVASLMGVSEGTVKAHLAHSRTSLREKLGEGHV